MNVISGTDLDTEDPYTDGRFHPTELSNVHWQHYKMMLTLGYWNPNQG